MVQSLAQLRRRQVKLAEQVVTRDRFRKIETIGGADCAFLNNKIIGAVIVCDYETLKIVEKQFVVRKSKLKYIPGYLAFREGPVIMEAYKKLRTKPDILFIEGHGLAHPRFCGLASYVGLKLRTPTTGIAKGLLCGKIKRNKVYIGKKLVGKRLKNIYVSPGHRTSLATAVKIVKNCLRKHRLPEPLYLAHAYADQIKRKCQSTF